MSSAIWEREMVSLGVIVIHYTQAGRGLFGARWGLGAAESRIVGSASTPSLSRPAQASLTLRPARLLARLKADFIPRLRPGQLPGQAARQLPCLTDNYMGGSSFH